MGGTTLKSGFQFSGRRTVIFFRVIGVFLAQKEHLFLVQIDLTLRLSIFNPFTDSGAP